VSLSAYVDKHSDMIDQTKFEDDGWTLLDSKSQNIIEKMNENSTILERYVEGKIYRGIVTGYNKAFVIDDEMKNRLLSEDPNSENIIKPFVIGRDIKRYEQPLPKQHLIFTRRGCNIQKYPSILNYLHEYKERLNPKPKNWKGTAWKGRKSGSYEWYEIQDTTDYYQEFEKPKITWGNLATTPKFCIDYDGCYVNAPSVFISTKDLYLLGILNSKLCFFYISKIAAGRRGGFFEYKPMYVSRIPIRLINNNDPKERLKHGQIIKLVKHIMELHNKNPITPNDKQRLQREIEIHRRPDRPPGVRALRIDR
jgi:hypothetical protein